MGRRWTQMHGDEKDPVTGAILGAAFEIANDLGPGFLEKVYERAMVREIALRGLSVKSQVKYSVLYKGESVGDYLADLVVEESVVVEVKCVDAIASTHRT